jgi:hypothetical protein
MEKSSVISFINNLNSIGVKSFVIRFEGGNRFVKSHTESCIATPQDNYVLSVETATNFGNTDGRFNVRCIPYEDICTIASYDLSVKETIELLKKENCYTDEIKDLLRVTGSKVQIHPTVNSTSSYGELYETNSDGEKVSVIKGDQPGRITTGFNT